MQTVHSSMPQDRLSEDHIHKIARLSRLVIRDDEVGQYQQQLSAVLNYVQRLQAIDLQGVEPLTNVAGTTNRLADDLPGPMLGIEDLRKNAPQFYGRFLQVPKILNDLGSA